MSYLIYGSKAEAIARSEAEGVAQDLPYYKNGGTTRYLSLPKETNTGEWALETTGYILSAEESIATAESVEWPIPLEEY